MAKDICNICELTRSELVSYGFNRNVEDTGVNLCGKHALEYYNWRVDNSVNQPDVRRFVVFKREGLDIGPRSLEDKLSSPERVEELSNQQEVFMIHIRKQYGHFCEIQDPTLEHLYKYLKTARGLLQRAKVQQETPRNVCEYEVLCEKISRLEENVEKHEKAIKDYIEGLRQRGFIGFVKEARSFMKAGEYDRAIEKYRTAESFEDILDLYRKEVKISLEISARASELTMFKDNKKKELEEEIKRLERTKEGPEYEAIKITMEGLKRTISQREKELQKLPNQWERNLIELYEAGS